MQKPEVGNFLKSFYQEAFKIIFLNCSYNMISRNGSRKFWVTRLRGYAVTPLRRYAYGII